MFEKMPQNENKKQVVDELWLRNENKELINRGFLRYLESFNVEDITEDYFLKILEKGKVLDVACGEGEFVADCFDMGIDAYGVELAIGAKENMDKLKGDKVKFEKLQERIIAADAIELPFNDDIFCTIINQAGAFSYAHSSQEIIKTLHEQLRVLKESGKIIINPIEIHTRGICPVNFANNFLKKDNRISESEIELINAAFNNELVLLSELGSITLEVFEKKDNTSSDRGAIYGALIITKIQGKSVK